MDDIKNDDMPKLEKEAYRSRFDVGNQNRDAAGNAQIVSAVKDVLRISGYLTEFQSGMAYVHGTFSKTYAMTVRELTERLDARYSNDNAKLSTIIKYYEVPRNIAIMCKKTCDLAQTVQFGKRLKFKTEKQYMDLDEKNDSDIVSKKIKVLDEIREMLLKVQQGDFEIPVRKYYEEAQQLFTVEEKIVEKESTK